MSHSNQEKRQGAWGKERGQLKRVVVVSMTPSSAMVSTRGTREHLFADPETRPLPLAAHNPGNKHFYPETNARTTQGETVLQSPLSSAAAPRCKVSRILHSWSVFGVRVGDVVCGRVRKRLRRDHDDTPGSDIGWERHWLGAFEQAKVASTGITVGLQSHKLPRV